MKVSTIWFQVGEKIEKTIFFSRNLPNKLANLIVRMFTKSKLHDHGCAPSLKKDIIDYRISWVIFIDY